MNRISPAKLFNSKWTAVNPVNKEKHFIVTEVLRDEADTITRCVLEAVHSGHQQTIDWRELKDSDIWLQGWK